MLIAFGCCLQMLNPGGKALHAGSTIIPHFPRTAVNSCSQTRKAQKNAEQTGEWKQETNVAERLQPVSVFH